MKNCKKVKKEIFLALLEGRKIEKSAEEHLKECHDCRDLYTDIENIDIASELVKVKIEDVMEKVDWRRVEREIMDKCREGSRKPLKIAPFPFLLLPKYSIPGIAIIAILISIFIYRNQISKEKEFIAYSELLLEKMERLSARNEVLNYLEDSSLLLTNLKESDGFDENSLKKSKELMLKKRFINQYLEEFPNVRQIASKIDFILMEFLMESKKEKIYKIIDQENLILKIKLVKEELKEIVL